MHKLLATQVLCYSASAIVVSFANGLSPKVGCCAHEGCLCLVRLPFVFALYRQSAFGCTFKATSMLRRSVGDPPWRRGYDWFVFGWWRLEVILCTRVEFKADGILYGAVTGTCGHAPCLTTSLTHAFPAALGGGVWWPICPAPFTAAGTCISILIKCRTIIICALLCDINAKLAGCSAWCPWVIVRWYMATTEDATAECALQFVFSAD